MIGKFITVVEIDSADGILLTPFIGARVSGTLTLEVVDGITMVSGVVKAATDDGKPLVIPFVKLNLPRSFDASPCGTLLQTPSGATTFPSKGGTVAIAWKSYKGGKVVTLEIEVTNGPGFSKAKLSGVALRSAGGGVVVPGNFNRDGAPSYWLVNYWCNLPDSEESRGLDAVAAAGLWGINAEWVTHINKHAALKNPREFEARLRRLVGKCRDRGLGGLWSGVNDNLHIAKHGNTPIDIGRYKPQLQDTVEIFKALGPDRIIFQPTGETQTATGKWFEGYCVKNMPGFDLCYNGNGSKPAGFKYKAYHRAGPGSKPPKGDLDVIDHGGILKWISKGGDFEGGAMFEPAKVAQLTTEDKKSGNQLGLYGFKQQSVDYEAIAAAGLAHHGSGGGTQPGPTPGGEAWNSEPKTISFPPMKSGRISINTRNMRHEPGPQPDGLWEYMFLTLQGSDFDRVLLMTAGGGGRKVRAIVAKNGMQMEIASDDQPGEVTWTVVFGGGQCHFELNGKKIGKSDPFNGTPSKAIAGGYTAGRHFNGEWRNFSVTQ